jgi:hypothetical protein
MGLDMYLHRKTYVKNWAHNAPEENHDVTVKLNGEDHPFIKKDKITYVEEEVGYWRKANAIHRWFVENCQNGRDECQVSYVEIDKLKELYNICVQILADRTKAGELLPPQGGFFFGSTDIDDWYFNDIQLTIDQLEPLINLHTELEAKVGAGERVHDWPEYTYQASW